jgi:hypothetical protein
MNVFGKCVLISCSGETPKDNGEGMCIKADAPCKFGYASSDPTDPKFDCTSCAPGFMQIFGKCTAFSFGCKGATPKDSGEGSCVGPQGKCLPGYISSDQ